MIVASCAYARGRAFRALYSGRPADEDAVCFLVHDLQLAPTELACLRSVGSAVLHVVRVRQVPCVPLLDGQVYVVQMIDGCSSLPASST